MNDVDTDQHRQTLASEEDPAPATPTTPEDHVHNADERASSYTDSWLGPTGQPDKLALGVAGLANSFETGSFSDRYRE
jgi:hypothetical protein